MAANDFDPATTTSVSSEQPKQLERVSTFQTPEYKTVVLSKYIESLKARVSGLTLDVLSQEVNINLLQDTYKTVENAFIELTAKNVELTRQIDEVIHAKKTEEHLNHQTEEELRHRIHALQVDLNNAHNTITERSNRITQVENEVRIKNQEINAFGLSLHSHEEIIVDLKCKLEDATINTSRIEALKTQLETENSILKKQLEETILKYTEVVSDLKQPGPVAKPSVPPKKKAIKKNPFGIFRNTKNGDDF